MFITKREFEQFKDSMRVRLEKLENPPRYKYGDTAYWNGKKVKVLSCNYEYIASSIGYAWVYGIDDGNGIHNAMMGLTDKLDKT